MKRKTQFSRLFMGFSSVSLFLLLLAALTHVQSNIAAQEVAEQTAVNSNSTDVADTVATSKFPPNLIQPKNETGPAIYIVVLKDTPLASYRGGIPGLAATNPAARGETKLDAQSADSLAYMDYLAGRRADVIAQANTSLGRSLDIRYEYKASLNGFAAEMTPEEAAVVAQLPNVLLVEREQIYELHTDAGPAWIGAPGVWDGSETGGLPGTYGEGVLVGVIDTGIDPWNPSFLDVGDDGYDHTNPFGSGNYVGVCDPTNVGGGGIAPYDPTFPCNDKLVGAWGYTALPGTPRDADGHGSHTASTTAGNVVHDAVISTTTAVFTANISGVAPHANIIMYAACCDSSALTAARDQSILDGVDVINYSIGSTAPTGDFWTSTTALSWLAVRDAGIFVANSAGNSGPGDATVGSADVPWLTSVAASSHNRTFLNSVIADDGVNAPVTVSGESMTGPLPNAVEIVYAVDYGPSAGTDDARLCAPGIFPAGTFNGEIVICERGIYGRVDKGQSVLDGGAGGMILAQPDEFGGGPGALASDPHVLPAVHIDYYQYQILNDYMTNAPGDVTGTITGSTLDVDDSHGDIIASFSSRGPNGSDGDLIVPNIAAPGRAIWAAYHQGATDGEYTFNVIQGTSMASPHIAGAAALIVALHPDWTPAQIHSALLTTSDTSVWNDDGLTDATPFQTGAGRVSVDNAATAGFVMDVTTAEFIAANPGSGGDPKALNLPTFGNDGCFGTCSWTRTVESTLPYAMTWVSQVEAENGVVLTVEPASFELPAGGTQTITVTADVSAAPAETWSFGRVWLIPDAPELTLTKDDGGVTAQAGDDIAYTLTVENSGTVTATGVVITENLPISTTFNAAASDAGWADEGSGVYSLAVGDLAPGASDSFLFVVTVDGDVPDGSVIDNTAHITGDGLSVGEASDSTPIAPPTDYLIYLPYMSSGSTPGASPVAAQGGVAISLDAVSDAHFPVAVMPVTCASPDLINIVATGTTGSEDHLICPQTIAITDFTSVEHGLTEGSVYTASLNEDPTNGDPYDNLNDVAVITVTVPADAARFVAEITGSDAPDIDLFIGTGDTPSAGTEQCTSTTPTNIEYCNINDPAEGVWWIVVQNWEGSASQPDDVTLVYAAVPDPDAGNWDVTGPATVTSGDPLTATISWNEPAFTIGDYWYGDFNIGSNPGAPGNVARVNVDVTVEGIPGIDTNVTDLNSAQTSGSVVTFTLPISSVGTADLEWSISEDNNAAHNGPTVVLYDNGPLVNSPGTGAGGADESMVQGALGMTTFGFGHSVSGGLRVSDQFTVTDAAGWTIDQITFFGYQTNSPTTSTFTEVNYNIWDGPPDDPNSVMIYSSGGNAMINTTWANMYRVTDTTSGNTQRPVMANTVSGGMFLVQGTYWLDWQSAGSLASGPWVSPITINGQTTTGDALQLTGGVWVALEDGGSLTAQGLPFVIEGSVGGAAIPCDLASDIPWASVSPSSGTNAPGTSTDVDVVFDATGLSSGDYSGYLCVDSNDPATPEITLPLSLTVTGAPPMIDVNPGNLDVTLPSGGSSIEGLSISNVGASGAINLDWSIDEAASTFRLPAQEMAGSPVDSVAYVAAEGFAFSANPNPAETVLHGLPTRNPGTTITHSNSQAIAVGGSVSCNSNGFHTDNSYYRAFDLPSFGITDAFEISSVDFGIEQATGTGGTQPVVVNLYAAPSGTAFPSAYPGSFTLIGTANVTVADQTLSVLNAPIAATAPANSVIVFELFTPSGQPDVNSFFVGSNAAGQTAPSYIAAAACGITTPTDTAGIGFPNMQIVMNVTGKAQAAPTGCAAPSDIPWLSVNPTSGSTAQGATDNVDVTFDATGLGTGVYTGTVCVNSNDPVTSLVEVPVSLTVEPGGPAIAVNKTVGTDIFTCAATDDITVASGTDVYYCYTVTNTGSVTLTLHDLVDDQLGSLLNSFPYSLPPGGSAFITATTNITATTVNTATWTAYNPGPVDVATASDSATVNVSVAGSTVTYCRNAIGLAIPDNSTTGVNDTVNVTESGTIQDVDVLVNATHSWDGDVIFTVTSPAATAVTVVDRPGYTGTGFGCSGDNYPNITLDDDGGAPGTPVETSCTNTVPGYVASGFYTPNNPLSAFDGSNLNGTWTINASDRAAGDTGTLTDWCVTITYAP